MSLHTIFKGVSASYEKLFKEMDISEKAVRQYKTGYCWLAAGLYCVLKKCGKTEMDPYPLMLWLIYHDKYEKIKYFINNLGIFSKGARDEERIKRLLSIGISDRGQWSLFEYIAKKHGFCTYASKSAANYLAELKTKEMNAILNFSLRCSAAKLRGDTATEYQGRSEHFLTCITDDMLFVINQYIRREAKWEKTDLKFPFENYLSLCSLGNKQKKFGVRYGVDMNVYEELKGDFINVPPSDFMELVKKQIDGEGFCWISCDSGKFCFPDKALFDDQCLDFNKLLTEPDILNLSAGEMFENMAASMSHTMVLTGYRGDDHGKVYFKVMDSSDVLAKFHGNGYISESWFKKFVFQAVINKEYLPHSFNVGIIEIHEMERWEFFPE